jgi:hypothetical protein
MIVVVNYQDPSRGRNKHAGIGSAESDQHQPCRQVSNAGGASSLQRMEGLIAAVGDISGDQQQGSASWSKAL